MPTAETFPLHIDTDTCVQTDTHIQTDSPVHTERHTDDVEREEQTVLLDACIQTEPADTEIYHGYAILPGKLYYLVCYITW